MGSSTTCSSDRQVRPTAATRPTDVYLFPAVVGGGVGDIDEVLCAGRYLAAAGFPLTLYRGPGRPLPPRVDGPWAWPRIRRRTRLRPRADRAVTVAPAWGITAAPARPGPLGRPGPWAEESAEIERTYGADRTAHVSLEEFARTLTSRQETVERFREGGVRSRELAGQLRRADVTGEIGAFTEAFRRFRAFDRPNVLSLFASFRYAPAFARAFPAATQVGPLWPGYGRNRTVQRGRRRWVWYASPASSPTILPEVLRGLRAVRHRPELTVHTPRPWSAFGRESGLRIGTRPLGAALWRREFRTAAVRIVTGSRTLLEALELGGPFLYFNGVLGSGPLRRRHRPEKIASLLELARRAGWDRALMGDLAAFSRGRRVADVVRRAADRDGAWGRFPAAPRVEGFAPGFDDAGSVLIRFARAFSEGTSAAELVAAFRRAAHR